MRAKLAQAGLGLDYGEVRLVGAHEGWLALGKALAELVADALGGQDALVEHVGSTTVPGLLSKPIVDLAVGVLGTPHPGMFTKELEPMGWEYRGDAGGSGGLVFVLETRPLRRVAHMHVVGRQSEQWGNYLAFRDLLRNDVFARSRYEAAKRSLAVSFPTDRQAYQAGKEATVEELLRAAAGST